MYENLLLSLTLKPLGGTVFWFANILSHLAIFVIFFFFFLNLMCSVLPELSFCGILFPVNILLSAEL